MIYSKHMSMEPLDISKTQIDFALAQSEKRFSSDPDRTELIQKTRHFKSSWLELAQSLVACRDRKLYQKWGYPSFEAYYKKELHIKTPTVDKLTGSYSFLHQSAPEVLQRDGLTQPIPSYQSIDFLKQAEEAQIQGQPNDELLAQVRQAVLEENTSLPKISRLFRKTLFPQKELQEKQKHLQEASKIMNRLLELLQSLEETLPSTLLKQMEADLQVCLQSLSLPEEPVPLKAE